MPVSWQRWATVLPLAIGLAGCAKEAISGQEVEDQLTRVQELKSLQHAAEPLVYLLIVDDTPSEAGQALRSFLGTESEGLFDYLEGQHCGSNSDPAYYRSIDDWMVVVGASQPTLAYHFGNTPALTVRANNATASVQSDWSQAVKVSLGALETPEPEPPQILDALSYWSALLMGQQAPANEAEERLLAALPEWRVVLPRLAVTRPDESETSLPAWQALNTTLQATPESSLLASVEGLFWQTNSDGCGAFPYEASNILPKLGPLDDYWQAAPCDSRPRLISDPGLLAQCGRPDCLREPIRREDGQVECRVFALTDPDEDCAREGWRDPEGEEAVFATVPSGSENDFGVCEIMQLEGSALTACRFDPECEACTPGWCLRDPWSEIDGITLSDGDVKYCQEVFDETSLAQFRFTLGVDQAPGSARIVCNVGDD